MDTVTVPVGDTCVVLPRGGQFTITRTGNTITVKPQNAHSLALIRKAPPTVTDFSDFAASMGVRVKPAPPEAEEPAPAPVVSNTQRPTSVSTMIGQDQLRIELMAHVRAAQVLEERIGHVLLIGPAGLGKTSLAQLIASETGGELIATEADALESPRVLASALGPVQDGDVFFIDETHGLTRKVMRTLLTCLEDGVIDVPVGHGSKAEVHRRKLPRIVFVCATTDPGELSEPFRNRFAFTGSLDFYDHEDLTEIVLNAAEFHRDQNGEPDPIKLDQDAAVSLARRSRGTPRKAKELLQACRVVAIASEGTKDVLITPAIVDYALELKGIDQLGLTKDDRGVLNALCGVHKGGPVGETNLANSLGIPERTLTRTIEPYLIRAKLLVRRSNGRCATDEGYRAVGRQVPVTAILAAELG